MEYDNGSDKSITIGDTIPSKINVEEEIILKEQQEYIINSLKYLSDIERQVLELYYDVELSQKEIASKLNISQAQVSRSLKRAIKKIKLIYERNR